LLTPVVVRLPPSIVAASVTFSWDPVPNVTFELRADTPATVNVEDSDADDPDNAPTIPTVDPNEADELVASVARLVAPDTVIAEAVSPALKVADAELMVRGPVDKSPPEPKVVTNVFATLTGELNVEAAFTVRPCKLVAPDAVSEVILVTPTTVKLELALTGPTNVDVEFEMNGPLLVKVFEVAMLTLSAKFDIPATDS
jgi:hypothetical protein